MSTQAATRGRRLARAEEPEWLVWAWVVLLLAIGLGIKMSVMGRLTRAEESGVVLNYPAGWTWMETTDSTQLLYVADPFASAGFPTGVEVREVPLSTVGRNLEQLSDIGLAWSTHHGRELLAYRALNVTPVTVNGREALALGYAYVPAPGQGAQSSGLPVVVQAQDLLFKQGDQLLIVTFAAEATRYAELTATWQAIQSSIQIQ